MDYQEANRVARIHKGNKMRLRDEIHRQAWRFRFAGRMIEKTGCSIKEGVRRADDALTIEPGALHAKDAREFADERMWIYQ